MMKNIWMCCYAGRTFHSLLTLLKDWTSELFLLQCRFMRRCSSTKCNGQTMRVSTSDEISWTRLLSADLCENATNVVGRWHPTAVERYAKAKDNDKRQHLTLANRCVNTTNDCCCPRLKSADNFVNSKGDASSLCLKSSDHCVNNKGDIGGPRTMLTYSFV